MKQILILSTLLLSMSAHADTLKYSNSNGCDVEVENRNNGQIFYVSKDGKTEIVGLTKNLSAGTFAYCDDSVLQINSFVGSQGTGIMMSCSEHVNGHATTRGRVDIEIMNKDLAKISIDGQVKGLFGWKQDTKIVCDDLVRK
ncbi:MAG: hypothetical protein KUL82_08770 [Bdellovibrio sp.]|nr:hypothetical protein [Bdellovibrio sp.]